MPYKPFIDTKYLIVDWHGRRPDRCFKFRHNRNVKSMFVHVLGLDVAFWYGDTSK